MSIEADRLEALLNQRQATDSYRQAIPSTGSLVDFSSNDYLGLAQSARLKEQIVTTYQEHTDSRNGATGSRLLTGTSPILAATEAYLSRHFQADAGLFMSSGYMANLAFFSAIPLRGETILYDELSHACIKDGARLSMAQKASWRHNDLDHLESKLKCTAGQVYIACESVYSMDGDFAPLVELAALATKYNARLVVDEAHSTGVFGKAGYGMVNKLGLKDQVFATIYTFGKAMGIHGAFVAGSHQLKEFLINFSRPFIYTTAPGDFEAISARCVIDFLKAEPQLQTALHDRIACFRQLVESAFPTIESQSAIQAVIIPGNEKVKAASDYLRTRQYDVKAILSPTVRAGEERLRICLHSYNTENEIEGLVSSLKAHLS